MGARWMAAMRARHNRSASLAIPAALVAITLLGALALPEPARAAEVEARLTRTRIALGEATTLVVTVRGAPIGVREPEFELPDGLEVLGTGRAQNFTFYDGKSSVETIFRFEIAARSAGSYGIGPLLVRVGREGFRSGVLRLEVEAAATRIPGGSGGDADGGGAASLIVDVSPSQPWVGQPCFLRVRLVPRAPLAEDPQYTPPATPGFWTDRPSPPESYYADFGGQRVVVTETRTRIYPLAAGTATVGEAVAVLALATGVSDPLAWLGGQPPRREIVVRSPPVPVRVRPLPGGAPRSFNGAVGNFTVAWSVDRPRTSLDVPVTVRFDVRGRGNLPLIRPPELRGRDIEVFASTVDDSLAAPGSEGLGRKRFQWTVLARGTGRHAIPPPEFAWFDPGAAAWRSAQLSPVSVEVGPPLFHGDDGAEFPAMFARHPIAAGGRGPAPWAWSLAGLSIGAAVILWRSVADPRAAAAARAVPLEWLRAVGRAGGPDFWRAADEAAAWLASRGRPVEPLQREIRAARYAGVAADEERVRRALVEAISKDLPPVSSTVPRRAGAVALAVAALALAVALGPRGGDPRLAARARDADRAARAGDLARAGGEWERLWRDGVREPGVAARLAWRAAQQGAIGPAAAWVVRGQLAGGRDPGLAWVADRVREGGGLVGDTSRRLPVNPIEWAVAALLLGVAAGTFWRRRALAAALALAAVFAGAAGPAQSLLDANVRRAVVREAVALEGGGVDLQPGQVVRVLASQDGRARVSAGGDASGWVPEASLDVVSGTS